MLLLQFKIARFRGLERKAMIEEVSGFVAGLAVGAALSFSRNDQGLTPRSCFLLAEPSVLVCFRQVIAPPASEFNALLRKSLSLIIKVAIFAAPVTATAAVVAAAAGVLATLQ